MDRIQRTRTAIERVVPWLALVATPLGLFLVLRSQREAIASLESIVWDAIAPSVLAFILAPLLQGVSFGIVCGYSRVRRRSSVRWSSGRARTLCAMRLPARSQLPTA